MIMDTVDNKLGESIVVVNLVMNVMVVGMSAGVGRPTRSMVSQDDVLVVIKFVSELVCSVGKFLPLVPA
jgi:hypothetical protein